MVGFQVPGAPEQVSQTRLVECAAEAAIRRPPVAHEHAGEVGPEDGCRIVEPATGANRVDRGLWRGEGPQPVADRTDAPARLVWCDHRAAPHLPAQRGVTRRGLASRSVKHMREAARRDGDTELRLQQVRDLGQRHPQVRVQLHDERDGLRTQLHAGRPQRIGGLQSVAALDAPATESAVTDLDVEAPHDGAHHPEVFLVLRGHAGHHQRAAAVGTRRRHRRPVNFVNVRRPLAAPPPTVLGARAATRTSAMTLRPVLREGSCLSKSRPPGRCELLLEVVALPLESFAAPLPPVPVPLDPFQPLAQSFDRSFLFPDARIAGILLGRRTLPWHHPVMPQPRK